VLAVSSAATVSKEQNFTTMLDAGDTFLKKFSEWFFAGSSCLFDNVAVLGKF